MIIPYFVFLFIPIAAYFAVVIRAQGGLNVITGTYAIALCSWALIADVGGTAALPGVFSTSGMVFVAVAAISFWATGWRTLEAMSLWWGIVQLVLAVVFALGAFVNAIILSVVRNSIVPFVAMLAAVVLSITATVIIAKLFTPSHYRL